MNDDDENEEKDSVKKSKSISSAFQKEVIRTPLAILATILGTSLTWLIWPLYFNFGKLDVSMTEPLVNPANGSMQVLWLENSGKKTLEQVIVTFKKSQRTLPKIKVMTSSNAVKISIQENQAICELGDIAVDETIFITVEILSGKIEPDDLLIRYKDKVLKTEKINYVTQVPRK